MQLVSEEGNKDLLVNCGAVINASSGYVRSAVDVSRHVLKSEFGVLLEAMTEAT